MMDEQRLTLEEAVQLLEQAQANVKQMIAENERLRGENMQLSSQVAVLEDMNKQLADACGADENMAQKYEKLRQEKVRTEHERDRALASVKLLEKQHIDDMAQTRVLKSVILSAINRGGDYDD